MSNEKETKKVSFPVAIVTLVIMVAVMAFGFLISKWIWGSALRRPFWSF